MATNFGTIVLQALTALAISLFSAWITVKFSQNKFRSERLWDRKVISYERVIEAFHKSKKFSSEHLDAEYVGREVSVDRADELRNLAHEAMEEIRRTADIGSFTLSAHALNLLAEFNKKSENVAQADTWQEHLENDYALTDEYMKKFIIEAKRDLGNENK